MKTFAGIELEVYETDFKSNNIDHFVSYFEKGLIANQKAGNTFTVSFFLQRKAKEYPKFFHSFIHTLEKNFKICSSTMKCLFGICLHCGIGIEKKSKKGC